jgi:hypothetical protein
MVTVADLALYRLACDPVALRPSLGH